MSATPPAPPSRPRVVNLAFWCWLAADVLTAAFGLLVITTVAPPFFRMIGGLMVVVGLAHGFLVGRARKGNQRFAFAAVGLALATVAMLGVLLLFGASLLGIVFVAAIMALMIAGSVLIQRKPAQAWFQGEVGS